MKLKSALLAAPFFLIACATSKPIQGPNGTTAYFIKCGSAAVDACYEEAAKVCRLLAPAHRAQQEDDRHQGFPGEQLDLPRGTRLSLFPMGPVQGDSEGLRWPLAGLDFAPDGMIGTSNEVSGPVRLRMQAPKMLVILPVRYLQAALHGCGLQPAALGG